MVTLAKLYEKLKEADALNQVWLMERNILLSNEE